MADKNLLLNKKNNKDEYVDELFDTNKPIENINILSEDNCADILNDKEISNEKQKLLLENNITYYIKSFADYPVLSKDETLKLFEEIKKHPKKKKEITEKLILSNMRLVISIAKAVTAKTQSFEMDDLCQAGIFGLYKAIQMFDYKLGYAFSTYATHWIRQSIYRELANYDLLVRFPVHIREQDSFVKTTFVDLTNKLQRKPTIDELYDVVKQRYPLLTKEMLVHIQSFNELVSLDAPIQSDEGHDDSCLSDYIEAPEPKVEDTIIQKEMNELLWKEVEDCLTPRELYVIKSRMGYGSKVKTLKDIGTEWNVSRERIRQIESKAIKKIRVRFRRKGYSIQSFM